MSRLSPKRLAAIAAAGIATLMTVVLVAPSSGQDAARPAAEIQSQRCFGAAARDPARRCVNRQLRYTVVPLPSEARAGQNSPCAPGDQTEELYPCHFGVPREQARRTIALVGDSHAAHWRAAVDVVAHFYGWHGISLTQTGCPMTKAIPILKGRQRDDCLGYNEEIGPWLERHPEVRTIITSQHGGRVVTEPGQSQHDAQIEGFIRAFDELPRSVEQIIVLRDTPWSTRSAPECIERAVIDRRPPGSTCAIPRARSLRPDLAAEAAVLMGSPRVHLIDLTPFMCGRDKCFPVVGGALVHKDGGHITQVFSRTLGPYVARYVKRLMRP
jgi:hypothetical protein